MDNLDQYRLNDGEREAVLYSVLKEIDFANKRWIPSFIKKHKRKCYNRINRLYNDDKCAYNALCVLVEMGLVGFENQHSIVSERGKEALKRGWVYRNCKWYNTPKATKFAILISLFALLLTLAQFVMGYF